MFATNRQFGRQELAHRTGDGIEVTLFWCSVDDSLAVQVVDQYSEDVFEVAVSQDRAVFAYNHPYAYAAEQGLDYNLHAVAAAA
jgi:hypothetical protein